MIRQDRGFTLVELLVVMAISLFVLVAASKVMISMTTQFKQQTRISEKSLESGFGLELMRKDLTAVGFGLPTGLWNGPFIYRDTNWTIINATYKELLPAVKPGSDYNNTNSPPKMIEAKFPDAAYVNNYGANGSSYLIIRSAAVGTDPIAGKFIVLKSNAAGTPVKSFWDVGYSLSATDPRDPKMPDDSQAIVISTTDGLNSGLVRVPQFEVDATKWGTTPVALNDFAPKTSPANREIHVVYGINSRTDISNTLTAPFNRVDYYVSKENVPEKCAKETGVLYRADMLHNGKQDAPIRVMDCVAMMEVEFALVANGVVQTPIDTLYGMSAAKIRNEVKRVDVYILTHEGQYDPGYEYIDEPVDDGYIEVGITGRKFNAAGAVGTTDINGVPKWKHYRWRVYKLSERPIGMGRSL